MGDDLEFVEFIQTFYGYSLTGHTNEHKVMIFFGEGGNGKSLLTNTAIEVIGKDYCHQAPSDLLIDKNKNEHPTILAGLFARRLVCCSETGDGAKLNQPLLKLLSGGDAVTARKMHQDFWEFKPTHKLVILTNHKPVVKANDDGIWRRLILVPFVQKFWDEEKGETGDAEFRADKDLDKKLLMEREGIFRWFVEGARRWYASGLKIPLVVQSATSDYKDEEDIFGKFIEEQCVVGQSFRVKFASLYEEYSKWCDASNEYPIKKRALSALLKSRKFRDQQSDGLWFLGIGLRHISRSKNENKEQELHPEGTQESRDAEAEYLKKISNEDFGFSDTTSHTATSTLF
jgi:putative DNA primase/helicase